MKRTQNGHGGLVIGLFGAAALALSAPGQFLLDGNMDDLDPGSNPDIGVPAGAWEWLSSYCDVGLCEATIDQFTIVETSAFDPGAGGNSLHMHIVNDLDQYRHLPNVFTQVINEAEGELVTVQFDIWVVDEPGGGGSVYVGGDHGGGGYHNGFDRGPQVTWDAAGDLTANSAGQPVLLVSGYPRDQWQTVQFVIDLFNDSYIAKWAPRGEPLMTVGEGLQFRSGLLDHLDRFTYVNFGETTPTSVSYLDNVSVEVGGGAPVLTLDGVCPGPVTATSAGNTAGGNVAFIRAFGEGSVAIPPGPPCAGTVLGLNASATLLQTVRADGDGTAIVSGNAPSAVCDRVFLQTLDVSTCATSNVVGI